MQKQSFLRQLKKFQEASPQTRDPKSLAEYFVRYADTLAADKQALAEQVWELLREAKASEEVLNHFASAFTAADTTREIAKYRRKTGQLTHAASIRTSLMLRARKAVLMSKTACPEYVVQDKEMAFAFADILGVRRPKLFKAQQRIEDIQYRSGLALKPPKGSASNGVYLLRDEKTAIDVRRGIALPNRRAIRDAMRDDVLQKRIPLEVWNVEELVRDDSTPSGLANDWNFHCFYGEIVRMGHIQRYPQKLNHGIDHNGEPARWHQLDQSIPHDPTPRTPPPAFLKLAKRISLALPAPYIRVDLLTSNEGPVLMELTARPGVLHLFDRTTDQALGEALLRAEARLEADLLAGKEFKAYAKFLAYRKALLTERRKLAKKPEKPKKSTKPAKKVKKEKQVTPDIETAATPQVKILAPVPVIKPVPARGADKDHVAGSSAVKQPAVEPDVVTEVALPKPKRVLANQPQRKAVKAKPRKGGVKPAQKKKKPSHSSAGNAK